jgi:hypothetical protein
MEVREMKAELAWPPRKDNMPKSKIKASTSVFLAFGYRASNYLCHHLDIICLVILTFQPSRAKPDPPA